MATVGFCVHLILSVLVSFVSLVAIHDVWPDVGDGFLSQSLFQTPGSSETGLGVPFEIWNLIDLQSSFDLRLMNSSWSGPAKTNIYQKGDSVPLQVFGLSTANQELFIQSCYATSSSNPMDKTRSALILNNGCVASKQSAMEFISRQQDSINLLLNTSRLTFSQVFVHCSVVFSSAVTPGTKSCNYNQNDFLWVELNGQTSVCECCASRCKGPTFYELKALVSTGPFTIKEEQHELSNSYDESSTGINQTGPRRFPSSLEKGWIVASATISDGLKMTIPYSDPWLSQPIESDSAIVLNQDPGSALSLWLPGFVLDVAPNPVLEMLIDPLQQKSAPRHVGVSIQDGAPSESVPNAHGLKSPVLESVSGEYVADSPGLRNGWDLEEFHLPEEELRGDVFMNYKWPMQHHNLPDEKVRADALASPLPETHLETPEKKSEEIEVLKQKEDVIKGEEFGKMEYVKKTMLTFSQALDGSSSLSYEEEERSPSVREQEVKKSKLEMERRKVDEKGSLEDVEKDLMQALSDVVRDLHKMTAE